MDYRIIERLFDNLYHFVFEYRIVVAIFWFALMFYLLRKLAKKDNDWYLKDFFKKK
jgi:uncharacterized membrane protein